jgi:hypothetical protein
MVMSLRSRLVDGGYVIMMWSIGGVGIEKLPKSVKKKKKNQ